MSTAIGQPATTGIIMSCATSYPQHHTRRSQATCTAASSSCPTARSVPQPLHDKTAMAHMSVRTSHSSQRRPPRPRCVGQTAGRIIFVTLLIAASTSAMAPGSSSTLRPASDTVAGMIARVNETISQSSGGGSFIADDKTNSNLKRLEEKRKLLVHQLADLIMNNEPDVIEANLEASKPAEQISARLYGQRLSQTIDRDIEEASGDDNLDSISEINLRKVETYPMALSDNRLNDDTTLESGTPQTSADFFDAPLGGTEKDYSTAGLTGGITGDAEGSQTVTCSPDYEDQGMVELASSNMTAEQQQQVLAGMGSSGLLGGNSTSGDTSAPERPFVGQCVQPGSRMIEIITKIITPILFTIIIVVGLLGNIIVMLVILEDRKTDRELTPTNLLILDLSLADLSFIIFCIPFTGWDYAVGHWVFGPLWCKFNQYLIVVCALSSIYTLVLMSIDRFLAIVYPIECMSYRTSKNMLYAICIKWILILLIASPTVAMHGLIDSPLGLDQYNCRFLADQYNPLHFQITFFITSYLFPLILIFCLYLSVLNKLWFGTKPRGHRESSKMLESKKRVTWLVAGIVVVFALCWCPIQVMLILMRLKSHRITATYVAIQVFSHILGYMNSCVNPIVYAFASETFTNSFKRSSLGRMCYMFFGIPKQPSGHKNLHHHNNHSNINISHANTQLHNIHSSQTTPLANASLGGVNTSGTELLDTADKSSTFFQPRKGSSLNQARTRSDALGKASGGNFGPGEAAKTDGRFTIMDSKSSSTTTTTAIMVAHNESPEYGGVTSTYPNKIVSLPLEPRDRIVLQPAPQSSRGGSPVMDDNKVPMQSSMNGNGTQNTVINRNMQAKQQLVARIDRSSNQVAHQCEPLSQHRNRCGQETNYTT